MKDFLDFAGEHPILCYLLAAMVLATIVKLIPWPKRSNDDD